MSEVVDVTSQKILTDIREGQAELRADLRNLAGAVQQFVSTTGSRFDQMEQRHERLEKSHYESRRAQWGPILSAGSLIVAIMTVLGTMALYPIRTQVDENREILLDHTQADGHPRLAERTDATMKRTDNLEDRLRQVENSRFTMDDGARLASSVSELREMVSSQRAENAWMSRELDRIAAEQIRRTRRVYEGEDP